MIKLDSDIFKESSKAFVSPRTTSPLVLAFVLNVFLLILLYFFVLQLYL